MAVWLRDRIKRCCIDFVNHMTISNNKLGYRWREYTRLIFSHWSNTTIHIWSVAALSE